MLEPKKSSEYMTLASFSIDKHTIEPLLRKCVAPVLIEVKRLAFLTLLISLSNFEWIRFGSIAVERS